MMTRTAGMIALAGAGAGLGFLLFTEKGRELQGQAKQFAMDSYERMGETFRNGKFHQMMEKAVEEPHPDTPMAQAFENALQPDAMSAA
jgi:hypothetical protein